MTIKFDEMIQSNKKTKFVRRIRLCLELKDQNGYFAYEWQNENKKWEPYNAQVMTQIADALDQDNSTLSITSQTRTYDIDLKKLVQTNTSSNVTRKIRSVKSSSFSCVFFFNQGIGIFSSVTRQPPSTSTPSTKRPLEAEEEPTSSKRSSSKSTGAESSSGEEQ